MFTYMVMAVAILALSVGFYNRYQAEKEMITRLLALSPDEFAIVKKVIESSRIEPSDVAQSERLLIKRLEEKDWLTVFNDGSVVVGGKSDYLQRKNVQLAL